MVWLVLVVTLGLRATSMTAPLCLRSSRKALTISVLAVELRPFAGLLVRTTGGLPMRVCVTVICRTRLFESLDTWRL